MALEKWEEDLEEMEIFKNEDKIEYFQDNIKNLEDEIITETIGRNWAKSANDEVYKQIEIIEKRIVEISSRNNNFRR